MIDRRAAGRTMNAGRSVLASAACMLAAYALAEGASAAPTIPPGGETVWIETADGALKTRIYATAEIGPAPVLIVVLHGDIPDPPPSYQYHFAQAVTEGYDAVVAPSVRERLGEPQRFENVVAAGVLRPGYTDEQGDRSAGDMGLAVGDNYTPEVVDAVAAAVERLKAEQGAARVILAGHSGGAAIAANVLGRHPGLADGALLVACGCDPLAWRARMGERGQKRLWGGPTRSLQPLALAEQVPTDARIRMIVGDQDDVTPVEYTRAYADALAARGVDVKVRVEPGLGHNMMFTAPVFAELASLVAEVAAEKP
jgi:pimeloyl-ACP methyl ester carboxylesterase